MEPALLAPSQMDLHPRQLLTIKTVNFELDKSPQVRNLMINMTWAMVNIQSLTQRQRPTHLTKSNTTKGPATLSDRADSLDSSSIEYLIRQTDREWLAKLT